MENKAQIKEYFKKIAEHTKKQDFASAYNLVLKILEIDPKNSKATTHKKLLEEIIKFRNIDIFSSTNLFMDPWED